MHFAIVAECLFREAVSVHVHLLALRELLCRAAKLIVLINELLSRSAGADQRAAAAAAGGRPFWRDT